MLAVTALASALSSIPIFIFAPLERLEKVAIAVAIVLVSVGIARFLLRDIKEGLSALETGLLNLKDGEYSSTLAYQKYDELGHLCALFNETVQQMRNEKHGLYQRELLLDKVTQSSPEALFLVNAQNQVVFSNIAARRFFNVTNGIDGEYLQTLFETAPLGVKDVLLAQKEGLFSLKKSSDLENKIQEPETWHMSIGHFNLNNQSHILYILKQMTRELSRQEVAVWKKVIRVISHELNNSLDATQWQNRQPTVR
jgi:nitrogen fixation/metabolism regulation signal transduction histidine kinase